MFYTKTDIANLALGNLAVSLSVADLSTDNSTHAKILRRHLRMSLDKLLEKHPWNFATQYAILAKTTDAPSGGFQYEYALPSDGIVLRCLAENGCFPNRNQYEYEKVKWKEINKGTSIVIWTNIVAAHAEYTLRVHEDAQFPSHFTRAAAAQLAMDAGKEIVTNNWGKIRDTLGPDWKNEISDSIAYDLARQPQQDDSPNPFVAIRLI